MSGKSNSSSATGWGDLILAIVVLVLFDALFVRGVYLSLLKPDSSSGRTEYQVTRLRSPAGDSDDTPPSIVVIGNSVARSGVQEALLQQELDWFTSRPCVLNLAIPGSNARAWGSVWLDQLADLPPTTVVLAVNPVPLGLGKSLEQELQITKTRAPLLNTLSLASLHPTLEAQLRTATVAFFRTPAFRSDFRDLLTAPSRRQRQIRRVDHSWPQQKDDPEDLTDVRLVRKGEEWTLESASRPRIASSAVARPLIRSMLRHRAGKPRSLILDERILSGLISFIDALHEQGHEPVVALIPETAFPLGDLNAELAARLQADLDRVDLAHTALFHDSSLMKELSTPRYFSDHIHLNKAGAEIATRALARFLEQQLEPLATASDDTCPVLQRVSP